MPDSNKSFWGCLVLLGGLVGVLWLFSSFLSPFGDFSDIAVIFIISAIVFLATSKRKL
ncbi:hypothetical protein [Pseudodesulfovibrio piezophilus]|uniref:hypothetical protein n=1 Tax=Pseudodesulfovibrio piezophilus TaxID=879567 RepID=UPI0012FED445|nr:hypothetical protein [Pseudodesulfovibrio piezophilus]